MEKFPEWREMKASAPPQTNAQAVEDTAKIANHLSTELEHGEIADYVEDELANALDAMGVELKDALANLELSPNPKITAKTVFSRSRLKRRFQHSKTYLWKPVYTAQAKRAAHWRIWQIYH